MTDTESSAPEPKISLDQFLKRMGWVGSGGEAKHLIQAGEVRVNGTVEARRGRQLVPGDVVRLQHLEATVPAELSR